MPRAHGRIMATIWNDPDFLALEAGPQRLYMFLLSQPDLSHAGLVPMRVRRWASKVANYDGGAIEADLKTLEASRFIVLDFDTEEVLIRTFVRNDGVYKQPRVMDRMREDARLIESPTLRAAFRIELDRIPLGELSTEPTGKNGDGPSTREAVEGVVQTLLRDFAEAMPEGIGKGIREGIGNPSERVSASKSYEVSGLPPDEDEPAGQSPAAGVSERVTDTPRVRARAFPHPPTPYPHPLPPTNVPPTAGRGEPSNTVAVRDEAPTAQTLVAEWIDHCTERPPQRVVGQLSRELKQLLGEGIDPQRVRAALIEWNRKGLHPSTLGSVVHELANRRPAARSQQATDDMFDRAMQRAMEKDAS